jgi:peptidoglycan/LPS O-acetylase OafA/YrhL
MVESTPPLPATPPSAGSREGADRRARITGLDALRGLAAMAVLLGHYTVAYQHEYGHTGPPLFRFWWARHGVLLFFMLSGFLILMTTERMRSAAEFAWARFRRLYPAYWVAVAVTFAVLTLFPLPGRGVSAGQALVNLTMVQNLVGVRSVDGVYWTLHVELYFYALVFLLLWRGWLRYTEFALLALVALAAVYGLFPEQFDGGLAKRVRNVLILDHAYAFLIGVMLHRSLQSPRAWHAGVVALCLAYAALYGPRGSFWAAAAFTAVLFLAVRGRMKVLEWRVLVFLGTVSYPLYLTHQNIGFVVIRAAERAGMNPNVAIGLAIVVALGVASAITFGVERPAMSLLRRRPAAPKAPALGDAPSVNPGIRPTPV